MSKVNEGHRARVTFECLRIPALSILFLSAAVSNSSEAATWKPEKNVEVIASTAAGGAQDKTARNIQSIFQHDKLIDVTSTVVNKPGGGGNVALVYLNQRPGDGHALLVSSSTLLSNHILGKSPMTYTDLTTIVQLFNEYTAAGVRADSAFKTGRDLLEQLRKEPETISIGVSAIGTAHHIGLALAAKAAGADVKRLKFVVFRSGGEAMTALLGGHIQVVATSASNFMAQAKAGKVRVVAVASPQRLGGELAGTPTWKEQRIDVTSANFRGIVAPRGLQRQQVRYWEDVFAKVVESEEWKADLRRELWVSNFLPSDESRKYFEVQYAQLKAILTEVGLAK